jgi:hypothetical protein
LQKSLKNFLATPSNFLFLGALRVGMGAIVTIVTAAGADPEAAEIGSSGGSWAALLPFFKALGAMVGIPWSSTAWKLLIRVAWGFLSHQETRPDRGRRPFSGTRSVPGSA